MLGAVPTSQESNRSQAPNAMLKTMAICNSGTMHYIPKKIVNK